MSRAHRLERGRAHRLERGRAHGLERGRAHRLERGRAHRLARDQIVPRPLREVFEFFSRAENLERITPPWLRFRLVTAPGAEMRVGASIEYRLRLHGVPIGWVSQIEVWEPDARFVDLQIRGPYRLWRHEHRFTAVDGGHGTRVHDHVDYALPFGLLGSPALPLVRHDLRRIFDYRQAAVGRLLG